MKQLHLNNQPPEIICVGMTLVDFLAKGVLSFPHPGTTGIVDSISMSTGGDAINQAITLAKLGHRVSLFGVVGDDQQGSYIFSECQKYGIQTDGMFIDKEQPTSTSMVLIDANGERSFLSSRESLIRQQGPEHINLEWVRPGVKIVSIGSLFCSENLDLKALPTLLKKAKSVGATTIADLVCDRNNGSLEEMRNAFRYLDIIVPSYDEAVYFTGKTDPLAAAAEFQRYGVGTVIVKLGSRGAIAVSRNNKEAIHIPIFPTHVVDTTGSGDNFMAGLISGLVQGDSLADSMELGAAVAALSVQAVGASAGVKDARQVTDFIESQTQQTANP
ncbi:carbohydrate kinase family protein [Salmonella enterica subsp. enterica serovar Georgia]|nr:carbohydrate kinase family protein [Salmonella enterica]